MGRKKMTSKEKVRIFAWRQENVTTKKFTEVRIMQEPSP